MTEVAPEPIPATVPDSWSAQLNQLKAKYRHVRPAILAALNVLLHNEHITLEDAKAQAAARGFRITAASVAGAKTLLAKMDAPTNAAPSAATPVVAMPATMPAAERSPRRQRQPQAPLDAEALVRGFVERVNADKQVEVGRLKDAVRKAIAALQAALD